MKNPEVVFEIEIVGTPQTYVFIDFIGFYSVLITLNYDFCCFYS